MKKIILKHALINALEHNGKALVEPVISKVLGEKPELKKNVKEVIKIATEIVRQINNLTLEQQKNELEKLGAKIEKKIKKEKELEPLPNVEKYKKVILRIAPYPSGPLHIGNARAAILNDEYRKKYKGKLYLVIDDTIGSEEKFILPESYELIIDGLKWLGVKWDKLIYKSDRNKIFYEYAKKLIKLGAAYVCECNAEILRKNRIKGIECQHRKQSVEENLEKFEKMLNGFYKEGEAVVRLKTDMKHPDPAFRDRVLLRISEREHPRVGKKYRVWPLLEFSWAIDDHLLKITHIIRGKELMMEGMVEEYIWNIFGWKKPEIIYYGLLNIEGLKLSKTDARKAIEKGIYSGWDDPRTWSLQSLRKRGIQPDAIRKFILNIGLSEADINVPAEILYAENRRIIDSKANRYFCVINPIKISIKNCSEIKNVKTPYHPDFPKRGKKEIPVNVNKIYIENEDYINFKNREIRLIDLFNIKIGKNVEFCGNELKDIPKIQWVSEPNVKIKIIMPDGSVKIGLAEPSINKLKIGDIVQFIRVGFARFDRIEKDMPVFYFGHR